MFLRCCSYWSYNRDIWKIFKTVLIIETVLIFIMFLKLSLYWSYNREILKKIQSVLTIETVLMIETWEYIFCPIWNFLCENRNLKRIFSKKVLHNPLMGHSLFSNFHFQMRVTIMGFAEHFGLSVASHSYPCSIISFSHHLLCTLTGTT